MTGIAQRLELRQRQTLALTPQLQMSLKLLQLSNQELLAFVEEELERNPLLERAEGAEKEDGAPGDAPDEDSPPENAAENGEEEIGAGSGPDLAQENIWSSSAGSAPSAAGEESSGLHIPGHGSTDGFDKIDYLERIASGEKTLREHLAEQVRMDIADPVKLGVALHLIEMLDESGYFSADIHSLLETLNCGEKLVRETLAELKRLDPPGVFAESLAECLAAQLRELDRLDPAMEMLLQNLDLLAKGEIKRLSRICGVGEEDVAEMYREIKALNPKPGVSFSPEPVHAVVPDLFLRRQGGGWRVEVNYDTLPRLLVRQGYYAEIRKKAASEDERRYMSERFGSAGWLVRAMAQRTETMLKVAHEIVSAQSGFFENGIHYLRPMVLQDIAAKIDMHESTVGRVTVNKYMATPRGTYELRFFFSSSVGGAGGEDDVSSKAVKQHIKELIGKEEGASILSDDMIAELLKARGVAVARRTVAKYREAIGIPSSSERRRRKKLSRAANA